MALGEQLPAILPPLNSEEIAQRENIGALMAVIALRMHALAPPAPTRHWYSANGISEKGPAATYQDPHNPILEVSAWLSTTHWGKGYGPSAFGVPRKKLTGPEVEVNLYTRSTATQGSLRGKKGRPERRVSADNSGLVVHHNAFYVLNLKALPYESAVTILNDVDETLDRIAQA